MTSAQTPCAAAQIARLGVREPRESRIDLTKGAEPTSPFAQFGSSSILAVPIAPDCARLRDPWTGQPIPGRGSLDGTARIDGFTFRPRGTEPTECLRGFIVSGHLFNVMSRNARCILPGIPYHVTQRGTNRQRVFYSSGDRKMYLSLLAQHRGDAQVRVLAYCLMDNHVHLVAVPERADSLAVLFRRVHGAYAQSLNARLGRSGHLWQNRFYSCPLSERHQWFAIRYVEANPVRAVMTVRPEQYRWSSAAAHIEGSCDVSGILDLEFWRQSGGTDAWRALNAQIETPDNLHLLRRCTYAGRPFGDEAFISQIEEQFQRKWRRWAFEKALVTGASA